MKLSATRKFVLLFFPCFLLLLVSCHSEYLNLNRDFDQQFAWKNDSSGFVFVAVNSLFRRPEGIATFPDGGRVKYEYYNAVLFNYNITENKLIKLIDFKDVLTLYKKSQFLNTQLVLEDSLLYYRLIKPYDIDISRLLKRSRTSEDSLKVLALVEKARKAYACNINTNEITEVDSATFTSVIRQKKADKNLRQPALEKLSELSYEDFGIILKDIYPQSKKTYIKYIVLKEGNSKSRDAVFEQIIPTLTKKEIREMLMDMDIYKAKLNEKSRSSNTYKIKVKSDSYDEYYRQTHKKLMELL